MSLFAEFNRLLYGHELSIIRLKYGGRTPLPKRGVKMSEVIANLMYSKEHEWVKVLDEKRVLVGITDFAQAQLGDIVFIELPEAASEVTAEESMGSIESVKAVSDIYSPVNGKILKINQALESNPEQVNLEPYTTGWIAEIEISGADALEGLLTAAEYESLIGED
jgi:glycine cleavage system H protein